jgi:uncharacterized membrane protein HdeD (DUF308 family)
LIEKTLKKEKKMYHSLFSPVITLLAGILVLVFPAVLNYIVAVYLIIIGLIGIIAHF